MTTKERSQGSNTGYAVFADDARRCLLEISTALPFLVEFVEYRAAIGVEYLLWGGTRVFAGSCE